MAGIVSATPAQVEECRRRAAQVLPLLQFLAQGPFVPTNLDAAQVTEIDTAIDNLVAAIAPLNTI